MVGLIGEPSTGKDTIADFAIEDHGFRRIGFADKIYECYLALDPIVTVNVTKSGDSDVYDVRTMRVSDVVSEMGWRRAKDEVAEIRRGLQRFGTEVGRDLIDPALWTSLAFKRMMAYYNGSGGELENFIFTDVRFPNEQEGMIGMADAIGGKAVFIRVERPGFTVVNGHASEMAYNQMPFNYKIINDNDLVSLRADVADVLSEVIA
jgi:hypothetical protein